jgi:hypothetical protein
MSMNLYLSLLTPNKDTVVNLDLIQTPSYITYQCLYEDGDTSKSKLSFEESLAKYLEYVESIDNYPRRYKEEKEYYEAMKEDEHFSGYFMELYPVFIPPNKLSDNEKARIENWVTRYKEITPTFTVEFTTF